jgi:hypothetical protein
LPGNGQYPKPTTWRRSLVLGSSERMTRDPDRTSRPEFVSGGSTIHSLFGS